MAAAWAQEAALPARTGVGEERGEGRRLGLEGTPLAGESPSSHTHTPPHFLPVMGVTIRPGFLRKRPRPRPGPGPAPLQQDTHLAEHTHTM